MPRAVRSWSRFAARTDGTPKPKAFGSFLAARHFGEAGTLSVIVHPYSSMSIRQKLGIWTGRQMARQNKLLK
jgi:hypothetical protein